MLTLGQKKVFQFIKDFHLRHGYSPTMAEIARAIGINSRGVAHRYVKALADEGLIQIIPNRHRNIQVIAGEQTSNRQLPLIGKIAAGRPIEAIPQKETIDIIDVFLGDQRFALQVVGDSMIEEGIHDGDYVVCEKAEYARNGQIVVALVDGSEATLKKIQNNLDRTVTLIPANSKLHPTIYPAERVQIQGIFVGLLRLTPR